MFEKRARSGKPARGTRPRLESLESRELMTGELGGGPILETVPAAMITIAPAISHVSDAVAFGGDAAGAVASPDLVFHWDFGDGSAPVSGPMLSSPTHVFKTPGRYEVKLTLGNVEGDLGPTATHFVDVAMAPIPELPRWESQMLKFGASTAARLAQVRTGTAPSSLLIETYYDSQRVFEQIAEYTGDPSWYIAADDAETIYRDNYVLPIDGAVTGYWIFTTGLARDYLRTGDPVSRDAVLKLSTNAAFARDTSPAAWTVDVATSREVAYNIIAQLDAEELGAAHRTRLNLYVDQALGHIDQWFVRKEYPFIQPFMVGLTTDALIRWYDKTGDPRVPNAIKLAADGLRNELWDPVSRSFFYMDKYVEGKGDRYGAPDLNLLIAPMYAWLYHQTGDVFYRTAGDEAFAGGVTKGFLNGGKQFDQNYRNSFDYVQWRSEAPLNKTWEQLAQGPKLLFHGPQSTAEGTALKYEIGSITDASQGASPWSLTIDWGDGSPVDRISPAASGLQPSITHLFKDNGVYQVKHTLVSASGVTTVGTVPVTVRNVAPTVSHAISSYGTIPDAPVYFAVNANDAGATDKANLVYTWDFGDGSRKVVGTNLSKYTYTYQKLGTFNATVTVTDRSGVVSNVATAVVKVTSDAVPELALYQSKMRTLGTQFAATLAATTSNYTSTANDAQKVYLQIADHTGDASYLTAAANAEVLFRDKYVTPNGGKVGSGYAYTGGLLADYLRTGDVASRDAIERIRLNAGFVAPTTPLSWMTDATSRGLAVAQAIHVYLDSEEAGVPRHTRLAELVNISLDHMNQWFVNKTASADITTLSTVFSALIRYQDKTGDMKCLQALSNAGFWLWSNSWDANAQAFRGINKAAVGGFDKPVAHSNLAIAPLYGWLWKKSNFSLFRTIGDQAFASGVRSMSITNIRDFNLAFNWSFKYLEWRKK